MPNRHSLRNVLLGSLIGALSVSALVGIYIFVMGDFGETEIKILVTTLSLAYFSMCTLGCAVAMERGRTRWLTFPGLVSCAFGFVWSLVLIWFQEWFKPRPYWPEGRTMAIAVIAAFSLAQSCLLTLAPLRRRLRWAFGATLAAIFALAVLISVMLVFELDDELLFRLAGVLGILDAAGTLAVPILYKLGHAAPTAPQVDAPRRFQFSLRSLLLVMLLVSLPLGWIGYRLRERSRQAHAVALLEKCGAKVASRDGFAREVDLRSASGFHPAAVAQLKNLPRLESLDLSGSPVSDQDLTHLEGLKLTFLHLASTRVSDAGLNSVATLKDLHELYLANTRVTDAGLNSVATLTQLRQLSLQGTRVTDAGLASLSTLRQLCFLDVERTAVTRQGVERLKRAIPGLGVATDPLEERELAGCGAIVLLSPPEPRVTFSDQDRFDPSALATLKYLRPLERVELRGMPVSDQDLRHLEDLGLTRLDLGCTQVADAGLNSVATLTHLRQLDLEGTRVTDAGLDSLSTLRQLRYLNLQGTAVTRQGVQRLQTAIPGLRVKTDPLERELERRGATLLFSGDLRREVVFSDRHRFDPSALAELKNVPQLKRVELRGMPVSDQDLRHLENLSLTQLGLARTEVTDAGLNSVATLSQLLELDLQSTRVTDAGLDSLSTLGQLRFLNVRGTALTPQGVQRLESAIPGLIVHTGPPDRVTEAAKEAPGDRKSGETPGIGIRKPLIGPEEAVAVLKERGASVHWWRDSVTVVSFSDRDRFDPSALAQLKNLPGLRSLQLPRMPVSDQDLRHLEQLSVSLMGLSLGYTGVTDAGMSSLATLSRLCDLDLQGTRVTDTGLDSLVPLRQLRHLNVKGTAVTPQGVERLEKAIPGLQVYTGRPEQVTDAAREAPVDRQSGETPGIRQGKP